MQHIPTDQRIITIEDVPELLYGLPKHENQVNLFYPSEATDKSTVTAASLMRSCLRMKPDRILLAELRGGETFDFLNCVPFRAFRFNYKLPCGKLRTSF